VEGNLVAETQRQRDGLGGFHEIAMVITHGLPLMRPLSDSPR
jgi:hypothetical protein